jgi:hypothetical protein
MISIEVALIMTAGMIGGPIILLMLSNHNWFKKETFKFKQSADRKEMNIRFKAMERDLKLKETPPIPPPEKGWVDTLKGIDPNIVKTFANAIQGKDEYEDEAEYEEIPEKLDMGDLVMDIAKKNPKLTEAVIDKLVNPKKANNEGQIFQG